MTGCRAAPSKNAIVNTCVERVWVRLSHYVHVNVRAEYGLPYCLPIRYAFEITPPDCGLRNLLVDITADFRDRPSVCANFCDAQDGEFKNRLGVALAVKLGGPKPYRWDRNSTVRRRYNEYNGIRYDGVWEGDDTMSMDAATCSLC